MKSGISFIFMIASFNVYSIVYCVNLVHVEESLESGIKQDQLYELLRFYTVVIIMTFVYSLEKILEKYVLTCFTCISHFIHTIIDQEQILSYLLYVHYELGVTYLTHLRT